MCEELYGLISLAGSCLGPALITQLLLFVLPHTHKGSSYFLRFFQRPALKAVLHVATCNCLGPVRQVIKTIEKCAVALGLPDNLFLICVNRNFDTALPSSKFFFSNKNAHDKIVCLHCICIFDDLNTKR